MWLETASIKIISIFHYFITLFANSSVPHLFNASNGPIIPLYPLLSDAAAPRNHSLLVC